MGQEVTDATPEALAFHEKGVESCRGVLGLLPSIDLSPELTADIKAFQEKTLAYHEESLAKLRNGTLRWTRHD